MKSLVRTYSVALRTAERHFSAHFVLLIPAKCVLEALLKPIFRQLLAATR